MKIVGRLNNVPIKLANIRLKAAHFIPNKAPVMVKNLTGVMFASACNLRRSYVAGNVIDAGFKSLSRPVNKIPVCCAYDHCCYGYAYG